MTVPTHEVLAHGGLVHEVWLHEVRIGRRGVDVFSARLRMAVMPMPVSVMSVVAGVAMMPLVMGVVKLVVTLPQFFELVPHSKTSEVVRYV